jgi:hypothetical protein
MTATTRATAGVHRWALQSISLGSSAGITQSKYPKFSSPPKKKKKLNGERRAKLPFALAASIDERHWSSDVLD